MLAYLTSRLHQTVNPASFEEQEFRKNNEFKECIFGREFNQISKNQYFQIIPKQSNVARYRDRQYTLKPLYVRADADFIEEVKTKFDPKTQAIAQVIISDNGSLTVFKNNNYVSPSDESNVLIWNNIQTKEDVDKFLSTVEPYVEIPAEVPSRERAPASP